MQILGLIKFRISSPESEAQIIALHFAHFAFRTLQIPPTADTKNLYEPCGSFAEKRLKRKLLELERLLIAELNQSLILKEGSLQVIPVKIYSNIFC